MHVHKAQYLSCQEVGCKYERCLVGPTDPAQQDDAWALLGKVLGCMVVANVVVEEQLVEVQ